MFGILSATKVLATPNCDSAGVSRIVELDYTTGATMWYSSSSRMRTESRRERCR